MKRDKYWTCRPATRQEMDEQTGVVVYKKPQETGRMAYNEMARGIIISVQVEWMRTAKIEKK